MSPIEIPAVDPHSASLIDIVPIEAMAQYAGFGAILLADIVAIRFDEVGPILESPTSKRQVWS